MNAHRRMLAAYRFLLQFYPPAFRQRFAPEMLEVADAAELTEWPLIFGDTAVAIVRCWVDGSASTAAVAEHNAYISLGGSPVRSFGLGFALSAVVIVSLAYVGYRWPPPCQAKRTVFTQVVAPPQSASHTAAVRPAMSVRNTQP